jgi:hypothetical protein
MDTAIFIMGAIAAQSIIPQSSLRQVTDGFDLDGFV